MIFGMVAGSVVSDTRSETLPGMKCLLVQACDYKGNLKEDFHVALDDLGAGPGEMVILSQGSSARQTEITNNRPVDAVVVGIVDLIDEHGQIAYKK